MAKNGEKMPSSPKARRKEQHEKDTFELKQLIGAFTGLPRVLRLVWSTSSLLTFSLALLSLLQGFAPAVSVVITKLVIDSVVRGIHLDSPDRASQQRHLSLCGLAGGLSASQCLFG